jgi:multiple sugar transport system ATP-binding protein
MFALGFLGLAILFEFKLEGEKRVLRVMLKDVTKIYPGDVVAVKDTTLEVADKEFVVLVGPSGCGKSTTLRMIAGLEEVTSGDIYIDGERVNDVPPKSRDIAMVFQNYALYPHMTVYNNMAFGLKLRKYSKSEIERRVAEAAEILGIRHLLDRKPRALSGGERQRVAVGRAIVRQPKVFLFDEPLSNLDAKLRVQMRTEISKLHTRLQATIIYVTHDQIEAMTMGDRIVVLNQGMIQQIDDPISLYQSPANRFVAGFIGSPPMNFVEGSVQLESGDLIFKSDGFSLKIPDEMREPLRQYGAVEVTFGIRPEDILARDVPEDAAVDARVEVVEPLGSEVILYLMVGEQTLISKVDSTIHPEPDTNLRIGFNMSRCHFFDTKEGHKL